MVEDALQQRLRFSAALNQLAEVIIASDEPPALLDAMVRIAGTALQVDRALVYEVRLAEGNGVGLAEWLNADTPGITSTIGTYPLDLFGASVAETLETHQWIESHRDAEHESIGRVGLSLLHGQMGIASLLWFPFGFGDHGFHLLAFNQLTARRWRVEELAFVEAVARQVNLALVKIGLMTERKRALEALEASEARYRALYDDTPSMFFTVSDEGKVTSVNRFAREQLGWTAAELLGHDVLDLFVPDDRATIKRQLARCLEREGQLFRWEARKVRKDGTVLTVHEIARGGPDGRGHREVLIVCDDVTDQKRSEQAMLQAQKLETLGVLVGGIAHDFNNLLGAVVGNAELALLRLPPDSPARELVEQAALAGTRSAELVKQLLSYSARAPFTRQRVNINELVRELTELLDVTVGKRAKVELDLQPATLSVVTDPTQLRQVLMNLVHNAADSMASGGTVRVKTSVTALEEPRNGWTPALPAGHYVRIEVSDTGTGIDPGTLERIFDPFFTTKVAGRGLGLSAVRTIAQRHGGGVFVDSKPGEGSTFTVLLPVAPPEAAAEQEGLSPAEAKFPAGAAVLVAEDDEGLQRVLSEVLLELGLVPLVAARASTAKDLAREHPEVRCALVDLTVPEGGGPALLRDLQLARPGLPVLLMSGFAEADVTAGEQGGSAGFLAKPFTPQALRAALGRAMQLVP